MSNRLKIQTPLKILGLLAVFFIIGINQAIGQTTSASKDEAPATEIVHFQRSTVVVADLKRSLEVYRDILGFKVVATGESEKDSYVYPVFRLPKEANVRIATLSSDKQARIINLKEVSGISLPKSPSAPFMNASLIRVDNLDAIMQKIIVLGLETTKVKVIENPRFGYKEQSFVDPDGHLVALYQLLPKS